MATPIGHALAGYAISFLKGSPSWRNRRFLLFCLSFALCPDLDFLPGLLKGQPLLYYQRLFHSLGFGLSMSFVGAIVLSSNVKDFLINWPLLEIAYFSHLVIDFWGSDARPPFGIPIFWPISHEYFSAPFPIFLGVRHAGTTSAMTSEWIFGILHPYNLLAISAEILLIFPLVFIFQRIGVRVSRYMKDQPGQRGRSR